MKITPFALLLFGLVSSAIADDWPHWMGPTRDNVWHEEGLLDQFPPDGPPILWRVPVAGGYAGPAVAGGKVFVTDFVTDDDTRQANFQRKSSSGTERVLCLDEQTGDVLWKHEYPVKYAISYPAGPRCTPIVADGKVYSLGAEGNLYCFAVDSGDVVWSKNLTEEYGTKAALWGYAAHPLVDGQKLLCLVGGEGSHIVAFDKDTGTELWRGLTSPEQGYSPPTIMEFAGARQLILLRPNAVTSVDPETGHEYWSVPYEATNGSIIMSPVRSGEFLYVGGYSKQNLLLKLDRTKPAAEIVWGNKSRHGISPINVQPFVDGETMYGFDQDGNLYAIELPSGKRLWETPAPVGDRAVGAATAFLVKQADRFWMFNERGELVIARLSPSGYNELDRAKLLEPTNVAFGRDVVWCMPAFANRHMVVRNDQECICVDLAKR